MLKYFVVLVVCALVVGCGGGSSGGKMAASDPVEAARRLADALDTGTLSTLLKVT